MNNSNAKRAVILGMPFGTASARLRKTLLFSCATRLGEAVCYRCSRDIESIDEFSIEHKEAWLNAEDPIEKFFSLDNIAYSHMICNVAAAYRPKKYETEKARSKINWDLYYERHTEEVLSRKRDRYHKQKDHSLVV